MKKRVRLWRWSALKAQVTNILFTFSYLVIIIIIQVKILGFHPRKGRSWKNVRKNTLKLQLATVSTSNYIMIAQGGGWGCFIGRYLLFIFRQSKLSYIWDCRTAWTRTGPRWRPSWTRHCRGRSLSCPRGCPCPRARSSPPPGGSPAPPSSLCRSPRPCSWRSNNKC